MKPEKPKVWNKPKQHRNRQPTLKQVRALQLMNQGMSKSKSMKLAGYSGKVANSTSREKFLNKVGVKAMVDSMKVELMNRGLTGAYMANKFQEWLEAQKTIYNKYGEPVAKEPDYQTQIKSYEKWEKVMGVTDNPQGVKRKVTFEEFVTGEEK